MTKIDNGRYSDKLKDSGRNRHIDPRRGARGRRKEKRRERERESGGDKLCLCMRERESGEREGRDEMAGVEKEE